MPEVIHEMSRKRLGMTCVADEAGRLVGVVTDGDLRRHMMAGSNLLERTAGDVMTATPVTITGDMLAVEGLRLMEERKITALVVVDGSHHIQGVMHLHDLWRTQMI
jgi:arabinose-5-phosphate isomerase